jgi:hypothetical protein
MSLSECLCRCCSNLRRRVSWPASATSGTQTRINSNQPSNAEMQTKSWPMLAKIFSLASLTLNPSSLYCATLNL